MSGRLWWLIWPGVVTRWWLGVERRGWLQQKKPPPAPVTHAAVVVRMIESVRDRRWMSPFSPMVADLARGGDEVVVGG